MYICLCIALAYILFSGVKLPSEMLLVACKSNIPSLYACVDLRSLKSSSVTLVVFITAENVTSSAIHCHLKTIYGDNAVDRSIVNL